MSPIIRIRGGPPECPLCGKKMREVLTIKGTYYTCTQEWCMISIRKDDPCCGKWQDHWPENAPKCPLCQEPMRWFFRVDKFLKVQCRGKDGKVHKLVQIVKGDARYLPPLKG